MSEIGNLLPWIYGGRIPDSVIVETSGSPQQFEPFVILPYCPPEVPPITDDTFAAHVVIAEL